MPMSLDVKQRGQSVATFRGIFVSLLETAAAWVPTTPEMEVKLLLGGHIWDLAQHADALGKRTHELRLPLQHSVPPPEAYAVLLADIRAATGTGERLAALYDVMLPGLAARLRGYLAATDPLMDAPTVRILERILADFERMLRERDALACQVPQLPAAPSGWRAALAQRESALEAIAPAARAAGGGS
jgi:hypothetical protein